MSTGLRDKLDRFASFIVRLGIGLIFVGLFAYAVGGRFRWQEIASLSAGGLFVIIFVFVRSKQIIAAIQSRQAIYGANVFFVAALAIGIAVLVNVIAVKSFDKQVDLTSSKSFTLSDQTKKVLKNLKKDVKVSAFFSTDESNPRLRRELQEARELLERYNRTSKRLKVEFVDPDLNPMLREKYKIKYYGTTIFESQAKKEEITSIDEQKFTSAIIKVTRGEIKKVYFLKGHDEHTTDNFDKDGLSDAKEALEAQNYQVAELYLATQPDVPKDCAALVIPGPKLPFTDMELKALEKYLQNGGKVLFLLEPPPNPSLSEILDKWGVKVGNDIVIERDLFSNYFGQIFVPYVKEFKFHQLTKDLPGVTFPLARSVLPKSEPIPNVTVTTLATTSETEGASWGETDLKLLSTGSARYDPSQDAKAPVSLAVAVQRKKPESAGTETAEVSKGDIRIVVIGDSNMITNELFNKGGGGGLLFLNSVNWLSLEEDLISIRAEAPEERKIKFLSGAQTRFVRYTSMFALPLLITIFGISVWGSRRA